MAQSLASDFKIYHEYFDTGFNETLQQNTQAFNNASSGAILLVAEALKGHYDYDSMFDVLSSLVSERDITSTNTASDTALTQDELIGVKLNRKVGPVGVSLDAMKKKGRDPRQVSMILGEQTAKAIQIDYLNTALAACEAALDNVSALKNSATGATVDTAGVIAALAKAGDSAGEIVLWVMHSKVYYDLLADQVADAIYRADNVQIMQGVPATLGRPVLVTDSTSLVETNGVQSGIDAYSTLGLRRGAIEVVESEPPTIVTDLITGYENIFYRVQGEHAFNLRLKGFKWDVTNGGTSPAAATVATGSNWDKAVTSNKLLPGVILKTR